MMNGRQARLRASWLLAAAVALSASTVYRALEVKPLPGPLPISLPEGAPGAAAPAEIEDGKFLAAVERNPFSPSRKRALARYSVPGTQQPGATVAAPPSFPIRNVRLAGTTAFGNGKGHAMIELPGHPVRMFRPGDTVAGFVLKRVDRGQAELRSRDSVIVLKLVNGN